MIPESGVTSQGRVTDLPESTSTFLGLFEKYASSKQQDVQTAKKAKKNDLVLMHSTLLVAHIYTNSKENKTNTFQFKICISMLE